jgi:LysR family hydrogen peroxide-inducible transcriptional activator
LSRLKEGEIDLALLSLPVKGPEFSSEALLEDRLLLAVPPRHPLCRQRRRVAFREVSREPFLLLKEGHCFRDDVLQLSRSSRASPHVIFEGGQFDRLVAMVAAGAGVTLLPQMARHHYQAAGIGLLELLPPQPRRTIGVARLKAKFLPRAVRAFLEVLRNCVRKPQGL